MSRASAETASIQSSRTCTRDRESKAGRQAGKRQMMSEASTHQPFVSNSSSSGFLASMRRVCKVMKKKCLVLSHHLSVS